MSRTQTRAKESCNVALDRFINQMTKIVGEVQVPAETGGRVDLANYQRYQVRAEFALNF